MKLNTQPGGIEDETLRRELRQHATLVNLMADGRLTGTHNVASATPTSGTNAQGDYVRNSAPVEAGAASSMYVVLGWVCVAGGSPGTWRECRVLTGN